jgi:hypothetical protein
MAGISIDSSTVYYQIDDNTMQSLTTGVPTYQIPLNVWFMAQATSGNSTSLNIDWVRVRKYVSPEPTATVLAEQISNAPIISSPSPSNGAVNVPVSLANLSFTLTDFQGDDMSYTVTTSPNIGAGLGDNVANGTYSVSGLNYATTYTWTVSATDGQYWKIETFSFTTAPSVPSAVIVSISPIISNLPRRKNSSP